MAKRLDFCASLIPDELRLMEIREFLYKTHHNDILYYEILDEVKSIKEKFEN
ncbi:hypothetical protein [Campylobacter portucalensis]|uniref:hypothetical protein n=1 Tax=Campylobacter portucalensis TaxID=2608384 RepID=UPI0012B2C70A|nr:hypothetical protein [Campylobacter portucalensis]